MLTQMFHISRYQQGIKPFGPDLPSPLSLLEILASPERAKDKNSNVAFLYQLNYFRSLDTTVTVHFMSDCCDIQLTRGDLKLQEHQRSTYTCRQEQDSSLHLSEAETKKR